MTVQIRKAEKKDAADLCILIDMAGDGLAAYLWYEFKEISSPLEHGRSRALREEGGFSYKNAHIAVQDGQNMGMVLTYTIGDTSPETANYDDSPDYIRPLEELEDQAPNSLYINVLSIYPEYRQQGLGEKLLQRAEETARELGLARISYITTDANDAMLGLGRKRGFKEKDKRALIKYDGTYPEGENWVLLIKSL